MSFLVLLLGLPPIGKKASRGEKKRIYIYVCVCVYIYIYMYIYIYIYIYIYGIYIYNPHEYTHLYTFLNSKANPITTLPTGQLKKKKKKKNRIQSLSIF